MARRAKHKKADASVADSSFEAAEAAGEIEGSDNDVQWHAAWDATMEAGAAARAKGIKSLQGLLQRGFATESALAMQSRFVDLAVSQLGAKKVDRASEEATANLLATFFFTLGPASEDSFDAIADTLQDRCREGRARAACISAYTAGALACNDSDSDRLVALRFVAGLWLTERNAALLAALHGWSALLATLDVRTLSTPLIEATLAALATHLGGTDVAVRSAAAEALGLLYQMCGLEALPDDDDELLSDNNEDGRSSTDTCEPRLASTPGSAFPADSSLHTSSATRRHRHNGSCVSIDGSSRNVSDEAAAALTDGFEAVLHRVEDLAANKGDKSKLSKRDRKASKRAAADVLATMNGSSGRCETITLPKRGRIVLDTLALRVLYRFIAGVLGPATQAHLQHNPAVAALLGLTEVDAQDGGGGCAQKAWRGGNKQQRAVQERARHKASSARMAAHMMPQLH